MIEQKYPLLTEYKPPSLLASQHKSFEDFEKSVAGVLADSFPGIKVLPKDNGSKNNADGTSVIIRDGDAVVEEIEGGPSVDECIEKGQTYKKRIKVNYSYAGGDEEFSIDLCDIPAITGRGTFVIKGVERVMLHQIVQAPGVSFEWREEEGGGRSLKASRIVPERRGAPWLKFEVPNEGSYAGALVFSTLNKKAIPASVFFRACGVALDEEDFKGTILGKSIELEKADAGQSMGGVELEEAAINQVYQYVKGYEDIAESPDEKRRAIERFLGPERFGLGKIGRQSLERKLGLQANGYGEDDDALNKRDLATLAECLAHPDRYLQNGVYDNPYCLADRRIRRCGDFLEQALRNAMGRRANHFLERGQRRPAGVSVASWQDGPCGESIPREIVIVSSSYGAPQLHIRREDAGNIVVFANSRADEAIPAETFLLACDPYGEGGKRNAAIKEVHKHLRLGKRDAKKASVGLMAEEIDRRLFKTAGFDLGRFGRESIIERLGTGKPGAGEFESSARVKPEESEDDGNALSFEDLEAAIRFLENPEDSQKFMFEQLPDARACMLALEDARFVTEREIYREFTGNDLLQVVEQCNILSGVAQKRRISCFGPGGLTEGAFGEDARLVERSHYGRICPIETPEGKNVGVVSNLAAFAEVNNGRITTPYVRLRDGHGNLLKPKERIVVPLAAEDEDCFAIRCAFRSGEEVDSVGWGTDNPEKKVSCRRPRRDEGEGNRYGEPHESSMGHVTFSDMSKGQMLSVSASLIPFVEHDDAHRALMGANMQRQAIPLLYPQAPYVGTGMESRVVAESGVIPTAKSDAEVTYADARRIVYKVDGDEALAEESLPTLERTNKGGSKTLRPIVNIGDSLTQGQVLADGYSTKDGELALGANLLVAYMCWEGYNYEDGIVLSDRVLKADLLTSVHIHEYSLELRDITVNGLGGNSKKRAERLRSHSVVSVGDRVTPGDVLATKITYVPKEKAKPSDLFARAIRGIGEGRINADTLKSWIDEPYIEADKSLIVPEGVSGTVVSVRTLGDQDKALGAGVNEVTIIQVAQTRKVEVGDKLAGRHGNKGVVSKILPAHEMPCLADGTPIDIILNPLGVPSRLNVGQLYECVLGWVASWSAMAGADCVRPSFMVGSGDSAASPAPPMFRHPAFEGPGKNEIVKMIEEANCLIEQVRTEPFAPLMNSGGKTVLYDGRSGRPFRAPVAVGYSYIMKLNHMVQDKMHARSNGPRTQVERQPVKGRSRGGGQRIGDMETWALEGYGARSLLVEMLTTLSDMPEAERALEDSIVEGIVQGGNSATEDHGDRSTAADEAHAYPETTRVLLAYLRALCLEPSLANGPDDPSFSLSFAGGRKELSLDEIVSDPNVFCYSGNSSKGRPAEGGLFSERVFGSQSSGWETKRERMGYIELAEPVMHPWFSAGKGPDRKAKALGGGIDALIETLPVLPAEMRPLTVAADGSYDVSDVNVLYRNVLLRNKTVRDLAKVGKILAAQYGLDEGSFDQLGVLRNNDENDDRKKKKVQLVEQAHLALQLAVDQLFDNEHCGCEDMRVGRGGRPYVSLTGKLTGKQGIIRKRLLGKRIDYSGRSVIAPNPELGFDQCGLPFAMAKELFKPWLIAALMDGDSEKPPRDRRSASQFIKSPSRAKQKRVREELERVLDGAIILLNRSPTLHRMGIQAFKPVLNPEEEKAIRLHPLACKAFNADFDGDTMAVYVPLGEAAKKEAEQKMLASGNILSPAHGEPLAAPSQDMVVGLYWKTLTKEGQEELIDEICQAGKIEEDYPDKDALRQAVDELKDKRRDDVLRISEPLSKKRASAYVSRICSAFHNAGLPISKAAPILNRLMWLGFRYATQSGLTISFTDAFVSDELQHELKVTHEVRVEDIAEEILKRECDEYRNELMAQDAPTNVSLDGRPLLAIADSGARGSLSHIRQVAALRGTMSGSYGEDIRTPILHSLAEGMTPLEYWLSVYGSRREVMNTALGTKISGEFARTLVNSVQDVRVVCQDCGTKDGMEFPVSEIRGLRGRRLTEDITVSDGTIIQRDSVLTTETIERHFADDAVVTPETIKVRSPFTCEAKDGICARCYGWDLSKLEDVRIGDAVGIVAAQSMSEPATQLTLSTFHGGGTAGGSIVQGLPLIKHLLTPEGPRKDEAVVRFPSQVEVMEDLGDLGKAVVLKGSSDGLEWRKAELIASDTMVDFIAKGERFDPGTSLSDTQVSLSSVAALEGRNAAGMPLVRELAKAYGSQGIDVDSRHLEVVAREVVSRPKVLHEIRIPAAYDIRKELAEGEKLFPGMVLAEMKYTSAGNSESFGVIKQLQLYDEPGSSARIVFSSATMKAYPPKDKAWARRSMVSEGDSVRSGDVIAVGDCRSTVYGVVEDVREIDGGEVSIVVAKADYQDLPEKCNKPDLERGDSIAMNQVIAKCPVLKDRIKNRIQGRIVDISDGGDSHNISLITSEGKKRTTISNKYELNVKVGDQVSDSTVWAYRPIESKLAGTYLGAKKRDDHWVILVGNDTPVEKDLISLEVKLDKCLVGEGDLILGGDLLTSEREFRAKCTGTVVGVSQGSGGDRIVIRRENKEEKVVAIGNNVVVPDALAPGCSVKSGDVMAAILSTTRGEVTEIIKPDGGKPGVIKYRGCEVSGYESLARNPLSGSFLAAAAFGWTRDALKDAVLKGETDPLKGFKERLLFGWPVSAFDSSGANLNREAPESGKEK